jgi:hypothetical protein
MRDILAHFTSRYIRVSVSLAAIPSLSLRSDVGYRGQQDAEGHETKGAALAVIEQGLSKALLHLALAKSTARICGEPLSHELEDFVSHAMESRGRSSPQRV